MNPSLLVGFLLVMTAITAELLIEQAEAIKMDIVNLEDTIRDVPFEHPQQLLALRNLHTAYQNLERQLHRTIALFQ